MIAGIESSKVTGSAVYVTTTGRLGVLASSERYKTAIEPMGANTAKLSQLRPVTFKLKTDAEGTRQYGLIAEEVDRVYPELVIRDEAGKVQGIRYDELAPMLLNEIHPADALAGGANVFVLFDTSNYMYHGFVFAQNSIADFVQFSGTLGQCGFLFLQPRPFPGSPAHLGSFGGSARGANECGWRRCRPLQLPSPDRPGHRAF